MPLGFGLTDGCAWNRWSASGVWSTEAETPSARLRRASRTSSSIFIAQLLPQMRQRPARLALHSADGATKHVGRLLLRQAFVIAENHTGSLSHGESPDC